MDPVLPRDADKGKRTKRPALWGKMQQKKKSRNKNGEKIKKEEEGFEIMASILVETRAAPNDCHFTTHQPAP